EDGSLGFPAAGLTVNASAGRTNESSQSLTVTAVTATADTNGTGGLPASTDRYSTAAMCTCPLSFDYTVRDNGTTNGADDFKSDKSGSASCRARVYVPPVASDVNRGPAPEDGSLGLPALGLTAHDAHVATHENPHLDALSAITSE